ncbi:hypothetical protein GGI23_000247 [Coemansia sp. RSA 2559]|nr:hypothetical protein GGI23_000247 [Coemansia sp. RSA 2559]KAJ2869449.1 hypothetical protein GGI22_000247 [Coemansia erecta]
MSLNPTVSLLGQWTAVHSTIRAQASSAQALCQAVAMTHDEPRLSGIQAAKLNTAIDAICAQVPVLYQVLATHKQEQQQLELACEDEEENKDAMAVVLGLAGPHARAAHGKAVRLCLDDMDRWRQALKTYSLDDNSMEGVAEFLRQGATCGVEAFAMLAEIKARLELLDQDRRARAAEEEETRLAMQAG